MPDQLFELQSQPGVRRDGTQLDSPFYNDGVWVRWQRGKPRKMGGYRAMSQQANGPVRSLLVDSRNGINSIHSFSQWGVQRLQFGASGSGGSLEDRTPAGFVRDPRLSWSQGVMTSSTGGKYSALLAASSPDVNQIDNDEAGFLYTGDMATTDPLTVVSDSTGPIRVSGGVCVLQPFAFVYGSNGNIRNSNPNDFSNSATLGWTVGGSSLANNANVAGTKFVHGAPVRGGGQSPAGLFWALDALVRVSFVGGDNLFSYDTISAPTSILGKKSIVEHDGMFFWPGTDRFLFYNGVVQELPNQMNSNWFFEGLNYAARNKVWGTKIARYGEIWWFYPRGESTECDYAVIYNYLEKTWYDAKKERSAGGQVQLFPYPIWAGKEDSQTTLGIPVGGTFFESANSAGSVLTFPSTAGVANGMVVSHPLIPAGTTVSSFTGTTVTLSAAPTGTIVVGQPVVISTQTHGFLVGEMVTSSGGGTGRIVRSTMLALNLENAVGTFAATNTLTGSLGGVATQIGATYEQAIETLYQQEFGLDKIVGATPQALKASFTSKDFGFAIGQPFQNAPVTPDVTTRLVRVEPDFDQTGPLTFKTEGRSFPKAAPVELDSTMIPEASNFEDIRGAQARILRVTVETNSLGGTFDQGRVALTLAPGDQRSTEST